MLNMLAAIQGIFALQTTEANPSTNPIKKLGQSISEQWCDKSAQNPALFTNDTEFDKSFICENYKHPFKQFSLEEIIASETRISSNWELVTKFRDVFSSEKDNIESALLRIKSYIDHDSQIDFPDFFNLYFRLSAYELFRITFDKLNFVESYHLTDFFSAKAYSTKVKFTQLNQTGNFKNLSDIADFVNKQLGTFVSNLADGMY